MVVNPYGRDCGCGSRGCWETEIGADATRVTTAPVFMWTTVLRPSILNVYQVAPERLDEAKERIIAQPFRTEAILDELSAEKVPEAPIVGTLESRFVTQCTTPARVPHTEDPR